MIQETITNQIESNLNTTVELRKEKDGANLLFGVYASNQRVASIYKSFDKSLNQIMIVRYLIN